MDHIKAPWTPAQVDALNHYQRSGAFHPFTCGGDRCDKAHTDWAAKNGQGDTGILVATPDGWVCPVCGYTQNWAHAFMAERPSGLPVDLPEETPLDRALRLAGVVRLA